MSSTSFRKPDFRLDLGYSAITLARDGEAIARAEPRASGFAADFRALAAVARDGGGRLTVVLPEPEVWRDRLALAGMTRLTRRRAARRAAAVGLGAAPGAIAVVLGARDADGAVPVAAVRRSSITEARSLLAGVGLRPAAILGGGDFPGFPAAPRLDGWRLPMPRRRALSLGGGAVAAALVALALWPDAPAPVPAVAPIPALAVTAPPPAAAPVHSDLRPRPAPALRIARAEPPPARPKPAEAPRVTVATRSVPLTLIAARRDAPAELRLAELTTARARMIDAAMAAPLRRPVAAPDAAMSPVPEVAPTGAAIVGTKPMPRPGARDARAEAKPVVKATPTAAAAAGLPRPRPRPAEPVVVASLTPAAVVPAALAATLVPRARPVAEQAAPAKAKPAAEPAVVASLAPAETVPAALAASLPPARPAAAPAKPKAVAAKPAAKPAPKVVAPRPVVTAAPKVVAVRQAPQPVRQTAAPQRQKVVARKPPAPVKVASAKPATARTSSAAAGFASMAGGSGRGNVSLIGVFGSADGRHALVRLPSGSIEKVRAGDRIQGVQVAAVGAELGPAQRPRRRHAAPAAGLTALRPCGRSPRGLIAPPPRRRSRRSPRAERSGPAR